MVQTLSATVAAVPVVGDTLAVDLRSEGLLCNLIVACAKIDGVATWNFSYLFPPHDLIALQKAEHLRPEYTKQPKADSSAVPKRSNKGGQNVKPGTPVARKNRGGETRLGHRITNMMENYDCIIAISLCVRLQATFCATHSVKARDASDGWVVEVQQYRGFVVDAECPLTISSATRAFRHRRVSRPTTVQPLRRLHNLLGKYAARSFHSMLLDLRYD